MQPLKEALREAMSTCGHGTEEKGGFILSKGNDHRFVQLENIHTGSTRAGVLFEADPVEYGKKVMTKIGLEGFKASSFHTHPNGLSSRPSRIDLDYLFKGFPINYIYATTSKTLTKYTYSKIENNWQIETQDL